MARTRGPVGPELLVEIDRQGDRPLHEQLERALREDIRSGRLRAGTRLPSTRGLAGELGVSRGVVSEAYGQLAAEGYLAIRQGAPVRVAATVRAPVLHGPGPSLVQTYGYHFHPGLPDLAGFPREAWLRSVRTALRAAPLNAIGYGDPRGALVLRETLASYLSPRARHRQRRRANGRLRRLRRGLLAAVSRAPWPGRRPHRARRTRAGTPTD